MFIAEWGRSPSQILETFKKQTPNESGQWGSILGVSDFEEADYYIIFDSYPASYEKMIDFDRAILIRREPPQIFQDSRVNIEKYFKVYNLPCFEGNSFNPVTWWIGKNYDELKKLKYYDIDKTKRISCISSSKWPERSKFVKFLSKSITEIEVWGRWNRGLYDFDFTDFTQYKGELKDKFHGLAEYDYSVCIENISYKNYWTEKIADAILSWSIPIYYGSPNIYNFFPQECVIPIDLTKKSIKDIRDIVKNKPSSTEVDALAFARNKILDEYNIWNMIENIIEEVR